MAGLPNWLQPTDVLGSISAGSNAGLRLRQIGDEEDQQQSNNQLRGQQIAAATALRQGQMSAMAQYRQQQIQDAQSRIKDQEAKQSAADALRKNIGDATLAFSKAVQGGADPEKAYEDNPGADPKLVHPILAESYKQKKDSTNKQDLPYVDVTSENKMLKGLHMRVDDPTINAIMGTNAPPGVGTNYVGAASALAPRPKPIDPFSLPQNAAAYANSGAGEPIPRQAVGKYQIGKQYKGGLTYLGGDPNDESSWQKSGQ